MSIIYTFPIKSVPVAADLILISDSEDKNKTKQVTISSLPSGGGGAVTSLTTTGTSGVSTLNSGVLNIPNYATGGSAVGITGSVQYKKSDGSFQGTTDLLFSDDGNGRSTLKVGNNAINQVGELQVEGGDDGPGIIKLNGENKTYYTNISGNDNGTENYTIKLPNSGPTGNNKILESTSAGVLSWIDTPGGSGSVPGGINGSVQFRSVIDGTVTFGGDEDLTYNGSGGLTVGEGGGNGGIITLIAEDGADSGLLKIGHLDNTEYLTLGLGDDAMAASYSIDFPTSAPGGNNKILQSSSTGALSWIDTPSGSGTVTSLTTTGTSGKATLTSGVLNIPSILIDGFETLPFTTANGYINIKGTYMFQMIAPSNCTPANFKFYSLLGQAAGGTTAVAIYKGALGGVGSLQSTGEITGSYAADQISGSTLTAVEPASDILAGDNIVVCLSFDSNISILGVIPITVSGESILSNASPVSNESLALFDSTTLEASQFPSSIDSLLALLSENTTIKSRPFLLIY